MSQSVNYDSKQKQLIHQLLTELFTVEELDDFCADDFADVADYISVEADKAAKIKTLIEYCAEQGQLGQLIAQVKHAKPGEYQAFAQRAKKAPPQQTAPTDPAPLARYSPPTERVVSVQHQLIHNPERLINRSIENRYRIDEILDKTGLGAVFKAYDTKLHLDVAIKIIDLDQVKQPAMQERVRREVRTAMQLDHPGVVKVYDFGQVGPLLYMIREFINGHNLTEVRQQFQMLQEQTVWPQVAKLVRQICLIMDYMHQQGVLHPGTKPENIMLKPGQANAGETWQPVLINLGLLRPHRETLRSKEIISARRLTYTVSPELLLGHATDIRSDVYAIGIILYELIVGQPPFRPNSLEEAMHLHIEAAPPPPRSLKPDLPEAIERVILKALAKDPADRYLSMKDMALALATDILPQLPGKQRAEVSLMMGQTRLVVAPGQAITTSLTLKNQGDREDRCHLNVVGLPAEWVSISPSTTTLAPGQEEMVELAIQPPLSAESRAGRHLLTIQAISQADPKQVSEVQGVLTIAPYSHFQCNLWPQQIAGGEIIQITVENQGNMSEVFTIRPSPDQNLRSEPGQIQAKIPAGEHYTAEFRVIPRRQLLVAEAKTQTFSFQVSTPQKKVETLGGQVVSKGMLPPVWALVAGVAICFVLGIIAVFYPALQSTPKFAQATIEAATAQAIDAKTATVIAITVQAQTTQQAEVRSTSEMEARLKEDIDHDGLNNEREGLLGTLNDNRDTDGDGIDDKAEVDQFKTNPLVKDTDYDGYEDWEEIQVGLNPTERDSDGDGDPDRIDEAPRFTPTTTPTFTPIPPATPIPTAIPAVVVSFGEISYTPSEGDAQVVITLLLSRDVANQVNVNITTLDRSAIAGSDYTTVQRTIIFPSLNPPMQTVTVPIINDAIAEPDETFIVSISAAPGANMGFYRQTTVTIRDND